MLEELFIATAYAQQAAQQAPQPPGFGEVFMRMLPMLLMVFTVFYFLVVKPQQQKLKAQEDMLNALEKGDRVLTSGGILGKVASVADDHVLVEVATNVKIKFLRSKIVKKIENSESLKSAA